MRVTRESMMVKHTTFSEARTKGLNEAKKELKELET